MTEQTPVEEIFVEFAGSGSHAALLAEALGIPTIAKIPNVVGKIADGDAVIFDGDHGEVVINPDADTQAHYRELLQSRQGQSARIINLARQPACTRDGTAVKVLANVGCREDVIAAVQCGADGVWLYRTEQFYLGRKAPPKAVQTQNSLALETSRRN